MFEDKFYSIKKNNSTKLIITIQCFNTSKIIQNDYKINNNIKLGPFFTKKT